MGRADQHGGPQPGGAAVTVGDRAGEAAGDPERAVLTAEGEGARGGADPRIRTAVTHRRQKSAIGFYGPHTLTPFPTAEGSYMTLPNNHGHTG